MLLLVTMQASAYSSSILLPHINRSFQDNFSLVYKFPFFIFLDDRTLWGTYTQTYTYTMPVQIQKGLSNWAFLYMDYFHSSILASTFISAVQFLHNITHFLLCTVLCNLYMFTTMINVFICLCCTHILPTYMCLI